MYFPAQILTSGQANFPHQSLTLKDAETLVLKTLKQVMEEKLDSKNVQLASVTKAGFRIYPDTEMAEVVARLANA